jgi:hypothetical protein
MKKLKSVRVATHVGAAVLAVGLGFTRLPVANAAANPVILVNDLGDSNVCDDTTCTLRGAVDKANTLAGDDVIKLSVDGTITLDSGLTLAPSNESLTVSGVGRNVELRGPNSGDWFTNDSRSLTLDSLTIVAAVDGAKGPVGGGGISGGASLNVVNGGTATLTNNTITATAKGKNYSSGGGAGSNGIGGDATLNIVNGGTATLTNNTIAASAVGGNALGAVDIDIAGDATLTVVNGGAPTLVNNTITAFAWEGTDSDFEIPGGRGSSSVASGASATLRNNVLQLTGRATCGGVTDGGGNVDSGTLCGFVSPSRSLSNTRAMIDDLASNGGPTQTKALDAESPAIGIGISPCPRKDQRGSYREASGCDAGAYEVAFADTTAPTASPKISPAPNDAGWNNTAVTISWNWADNTNGSGLAEDICALTTPVSTTGANTVSSDCEDQFRNQATTAKVTVNIDTTAPTVTVTGVTDGASYVSTAVPTAECSTTDATSGVATNATAATTSATDTVTITCSGATDKSGNTQTVPVRATYTLLAPKSELKPVHQPAKEPAKEPAPATIPVVAVAPDTTTTIVAASAPAAPSSSPTLNLSASAATEGNTVTATADGFKEGSEVTFELHSDPITLGKTNADANGRATLTATLPTGVFGQHNIVATGISSAGQPVALKAPIVIAPKIESLPQAPIATAAPAAETPNTLALTGGNVAAITAAAIAMILVGISLRRTKTQK